MLIVRSWNWWRGGNWIKHISKPPHFLKGNASSINSARRRYCLNQRTNYRESWWRLVSYVLSGDTSTPSPFLWPSWPSGQPSFLDWPTWTLSRPSWLRGWVAEADWLNSFVTRNRSSSSFARAEATRVGSCKRFTQINIKAGVHRNRICSYRRPIVPKWNPHTQIYKQETHTNTEIQTGDSHI